MGWSPILAANAFLNTLKLSKHEKGRLCNCCKTPEPESNAFISALAAGMNAQLLVEVSCGSSCSSIALAAAAQQTGGRLICIFPDPKPLAKSKQVIKDAGLKDLVEFKVGDPFNILPSYEKVDFAYVDCATDDHTSLLKTLNVNPTRSVVVASNLDGERKGLGNVVRGMKHGSCAVRCTKNLIGKDMEVTMIGKKDEFAKQGKVERARKSQWVAKVDEETGEEHIYRVPKQS